MRELPGVPGGEPTGKGTGVPHGVPDGVWVLMTDEAAGVALPLGVCGPALMTDGDGAGAGEEALML